MYMTPQKKPPVLTGKEYYEKYALDDALRFIEEMAEYGYDCNMTMLTDTIVISVYEVND